MKARFFVKILTIIFVFLAGTVFVGNEETYYTKEGIVTECNNNVTIIVINDTKKKVIVNDKDVTDARVNDKIIVTFHNNHTINNNDDFIVKIKRKQLTN